MLTRKHAAALAAVIQREREALEAEPLMVVAIQREVIHALNRIQRGIFNVLLDSNPRMDSHRFDKACEAGPKSTGHQEGLYK